MLLYEYSVKICQALKNTIYKEKWKPLNFFLATNQSDWF